MGKKMRIKKYNIQERGRNIPLVIAIIAISIVPLLVRFYFVKSNLGQYSWYPSVDGFTDLFSYVKARMIILLGVISFAYLLMNFKIFKAKISSNKNKEYYLVVGVLISIFLSTLFSSNKLFSLMGYPERYEGALVWIAYMFIFLCVALHKWETKELSWIINSMLISSLIICALGLLQYFGFNFIQHKELYPFLKSFGFPFESLTIDQQVKENSIFSTLYHYNNYGTYIAIVTPVFLSAVFKKRDRHHKVLFFLVATLLIISLWLSTARGGIIALLVVTVVLIILNFKSITLKNRKKLFLICFCVMVLAGGLEVMNGFETVHRIFPNHQVGALKPSFEALSLKDDHIYLSGLGHTFEVASNQIETENWSLNFYLDDKEVFPSGTGADQFYHFSETGIERVAFILEDSGDGPKLGLKVDEKIWAFTSLNNQLVFINPYGKADKLLNPDKLFSIELDTKGSSRFFIWSRTMPLILKNPIIGYGLDNFPAVFPQADYYGKYLAYDTEDIIIDKPHNMYLQLLVSGGILLFLSVMGLFVAVLYQFFTFKVKSDDCSFEYFEGIALGLVGCLVAGIFYDFSVQTSSLIFVFLGLGTSFATNSVHNKADSGGNL